MTFATILVIIAIILAVVAMFVEVYGWRLLGGAVVLLGIAVLIGVSPIALS